MERVWKFFRQRGGFARRKFGIADERIFAGWRRGDKTKPPRRSAAANNLSGLTTIFFRLQKGIRIRGSRVLPWHSSRFFSDLDFTGFWNWTLWPFWFFGYRRFSLDQDS